MYKSRVNSHACSGKLNELNGQKASGTSSDAVLLAITLDKINITLVKLVNHISAAAAVSSPVSQYKHRVLIILEFVATYKHKVVIILEFVASYKHKVVIILEFVATMEKKSKLRRERPQRRS